MKRNQICFVSRLEKEQEKNLSFLKAGFADQNVAWARICRWALSPPGGGPGGWLRGGTGRGPRTYPPPPPPPRPVSAHVCHTEDSVSREWLPLTGILGKCISVLSIGPWGFYSLPPNWPVFKTASSPTGGASEPQRVFGPHLEGRLTNGHIEYTSA